MANARYPRVRLARGRQQRLQTGHPWVYRTDVESIVGEPRPGDTVDVADSRGQFLGRGYINPHSMLLVRLLTHDPHEDINLDLIRRRVQAAWEHRRRYLPNVESVRLIFGEADFLPGLIVDKFGDVLVMQSLALGIDKWQDEIADLLMELVQPTAIYERNDAPVRELEGLPLRKGLLRGEAPAQFWIRENGLEILVDVEKGQKTGHFLDQRENRAAIRPYCQHARVLDAFCNTGGFALNAMAAGAASVVAVDSSAEALGAAFINAKRNGMDASLSCLEANVFDYLRSAVTLGEQFDVVVLDPPAFAKNRKALEGAVRGYKEINLRAMKLLAAGGILVTCSCSYHMTPDLFSDVVHDAALDARRRLRLLDDRSQPLDHPVLVGYDESRYLKCLVYQVI